MHIAEAEKEFLSLVAAQGISMPSTYPLELFPIVCLFWDQWRAVDAKSLDESGDGLLFQWGARPAAPGFWDSCYYVDLTRQLVASDGDDDGAFSHLRCEFQYLPSKELDALGEGNRWCFDTADLAEFMEFVLSHPVLQLAGRAQPKKLVCGMEKV
jgi:hypothetical protein